MDEYLIFFIGKSNKNKMIRLTAERYTRRYKVFIFPLFSLGIFVHVNQKGVYLVARFRSNTHLQYTVRPFTHLVLFVNNIAFSIAVIQSLSILSEEIQHFSSHLHPLTFTNISFYQHLSPDASLKKRNPLSH